MSVRAWDLRRHLDIDDKTRRAWRKEGIQFAWPLPRDPGLATLVTIALEDANQLIKIRFGSYRASRR